MVNQTQRIEPTKNELQARLVGLMADARAAARELVDKHDVVPVLISNSSHDYSIYHHDFISFMSCGKPSNDYVDKPVGKLVVNRSSTELRRELHHLMEEVRHIGQELFKKHKAVVRLEFLDGSVNAFNYQHSVCTPFKVLKKKWEKTKSCPGTEKIK